VWFSIFGKGHLFEVQGLKFQVSGWVGINALVPFEHLEILIFIRMTDSMLVASNTFLVLLSRQKNEKLPAAKKWATVTEPLLPFINGPLRLKLVYNAKSRCNKRPPQIFRLPQSANSFKAGGMFHRNHIMFATECCL
jgi:hypothetical protein